MDRLHQLLLDISFTPEPSLVNFIPGTNQELLTYLSRLSCLENNVEKIIYIWGDPGCGKSHLLKATVNAVIVNGGNAGYFGSGQVPRASMAETHNLLAIDDVSMLDAQMQIGLFDLFNRVKEEKGHLLICGDNTPSALNLRPDVTTRLGWGLIFHLKTLSDHDKREALLAHAQFRGFSLSREVVDYLLSHTERDMSSLMCLLDAIDLCSLEMKRPITLPLLRELLSNSG